MSKDIIYRQAAIDALLDKGQASRRYKLGETWELNLDEIMEAIGSLPSAQPERIRGRWEVYVISMLDGEGCKCSECGFDGVPYWNFCPNCGADMRGDKDDESRSNSNAQTNTRARGMGATAKSSGI